MKNKPMYSKVRHIESGREFLAEYSSEAAEWYEKGTGRAYNSADIVILELRPA